MPVVTFVSIGQLINYTSLIILFNTSLASRQKGLTVYTNDWYLDPFALKLTTGYLKLHYNWFIIRQGFQSSYFEISDSFVHAVICFSGFSKIFWRKMIMIETEFYNQTAPPVIGLGNDIISLEAINHVSTMGKSSEMMHGSLYIWISLRDLIIPGNTGTMSVVDVLSMETQAPWAL